MSTIQPLLVIACGALAHEIQALKKHHGWEHLVVQCLPADLHNLPHKIPEKLREKIRAAKSSGKFRDIFAAYADCGTGGLIDNVLREENVERLPGAHCYEFFAKSALFEQLSEEELGTFYLTDFLARHFQRLVIQGFGLDKHPEMKAIYFQHYKRMVYLSQTHNPKLVELAKQAAKSLDLSYEERHVGYGEMQESLLGKYQQVIQWQN